MISRLVVSGCSYMNYYHAGGGSNDLAARLGINSAISYATPGSCNDRIIRSVLRDCFETQEPTLYIVGLTFLHRYELPIRAEPTSDGLWLSCTGKPADKKSSDWRPDILLDEYNTYCSLKAHMFYLTESLEKLMYSLLAMIHTVKSLGHRIVIFNTAEMGVDEFLDQDRFRLLAIPEIVDSYRWRSIPYQFDQGAKWDETDTNLALHVRHVAPGEHQWLNEFLTNYIHEYKIIQ